MKKYDTAITTDRDTITELGMLVVMKYPEVAASLARELDSDPPLDDDFSRISIYFESYAACIGKGVDDLIKIDRSRARLLCLKTFIAAMIRIYKPHKITISGEILQNGFSATLATTINKPKSHITNLVKEVMVLDRAYEDFRAEVDYFEYYLASKH